MISWCRIRSWTSTGPSFSSESATRRRSAGTSPWPGPFGFACEKCRIGHESPSPDACPPSAGVMSEKIRDLRRARRARRVVRLSGGRELLGEQARPAARPGAIAVSVRPARRCRRWMPLRGSLGAWAGVPVLNASAAAQGGRPGPLGRYVQKTATATLARARAPMVMKAGVFRGRRRPTRMRTSAARTTSSLTVILTLFTSASSAP